MTRELRRRFCQKAAVDALQGMRSTVMVKAALRWRSSTHATYGRTAAEFRINTFSAEIEANCDIGFSATGDNDVELDARAREVMFCNPL